MISPLEMFLKWEKETPSSIMLRQPFAGKWKTWSYRQAGDEVRRVATGINKLNLPAGSRIALLSKNCAHWIMADLAIMMSGNISVPLYPTLPPPSIRQILEHSEASAIIIGKLDNYLAHMDGVPASVARIGISAYGAHEPNNWEHWVGAHEPLVNPAQWHAEDILTIIYTSGTTGEPKGVMHSAGAFDALVTATFRELSLALHPKLFSYLPLSHIAERGGIEMYGLNSGAIFSFAESLESFPADVMSVQPTMFFAVPRIWSKFREKILEKLPQSRLNLLLSIPIVNSIVKGSIRKKLGLSSATHIYSGAAPIAVELLKWFERLDIIIFQALGMTEDCIFSHYNRFGANKFGTVGKPITGVVAKISEEGELRLKNPSMMKGYYKDVEMTNAAFDEEGFFRTGDLVEYDAQGFLTVTGRLKDQFKTDKGKYISPAPIETGLLINTDIEQICVVGMGIPQPIALIVLSASAKAKSKVNIDRGLIDSLTTINSRLQKYERLEKIIVMSQDWTIDNGLITPTLKVKRGAVEKINLQHYSEWFDSNETIVWT